MASGAFGSQTKRPSKRQPYMTAGIKPSTNAATFRPSSGFHFNPTAAKIPTFSQPRKPSSSATGLHLGGAGLGDYAPAGGTSASGGGHSLLGIGGDAIAFIGHLANDVRTTAVGLPMGITHLMTQSPIKSAEEIAKVTWHDWSPLFQGDYGTWAHNFYEHPLGPLLDVTSFVDGGASLAARGVELASKVGEATAAIKGVEITEAGAKVAQTAARGVRGTPLYLHGATAAARDIGRVVGEGGTQTSELWQKMAKWSNPAKYAERVYRHTGEKLGFNGERLNDFVREALKTDPAVTHTLRDEAGLEKFLRVKRNPVQEARSNLIRKAGNAAAKSAAGKSLKIDKVLGDAAKVKRWNAMDKAIRKVSMSNIMANQLHQISQLGELLTHLSPSETMMKMHTPMRAGLIDQARSVVRPAGMADEDWVRALAEKGYQPVHASPDMSTIVKRLDKAHAAGDAEKVDQIMRQTLTEDWAKANVTDNLDNALRDGQDRLLVVSKTKAVAQGMEAHGASKVAKLLYTNPTKYWSMMLLGYSPRYFTNNLIGNWTMLMSATDPVTATLGMVKHIRAAKNGDRAFNASIAHLPANEQAEAKLLRSVGTGGSTWSGEDWINKWYGAEHGWAKSNTLDSQGKVLGTLSKHSLHGVTHRLADMPFREMAMRYTIRRLPEFQGAYAKLRSQGMSHWEAEAKAADQASKSAVVRQLVREQVHHMLGQYHTFSETERAIKNVVPFYAWLRAITKHMAYLTASEPYKVAMGAAIGSMGAKYQEELLGKLPDFMAGAIPAAALGPLGLIAGHSPGRVSVFNTAGVNPYATAGDLASMGSAALGIGDKKVGETLGLTLNPILQGVMEQATGSSLLTGIPQPAAKGGPLAGIVGSVFGNLPQVSIIKGAMASPADSVTKAGNPTLYKKDLQSPLSSFLGVPIRQYDPNSAETIRKRQKKIKNSNFPTAPIMPGMPGY